MSRPPDGPAYVYSQEYKDDYYYDAQRQAYIFRNGRVMPGSPQVVLSTPRVAPTNDAVSSSSVQAQYQYQSSSNQRYGTTSGGPALPPNTGRYTSQPEMNPMRALTDRMAGASLIARDSNINQTPQTVQAQLQRRDSAQQPIVLRGFNNETRVRTAVQTAPSQGITEPSLRDEGFQAHRRLLETEGDEEDLDPDFRLRPHPRKFFVVGRVFLILWAEPAGENSIVSGWHTLPGRHKQKVFSKVRRFVVVREGDQACSALPILTYSGNGTVQKNQSDHGIVYIGKSEPQRSSFEPNLQPYAVRVDPDLRDEKLHPMSRINYAKIYTIEHNLKVKPFGMVSQETMPRLIDQFRNVWVFRVGERQRQQGGSSTRALVRPDLLPAYQGPSSSRGNTENNASIPVRTSFTPRQAAAMNTHGRLAADIQDAGNRSSERGAPSASSNRARNLADREGQRPSERPALTAEQGEAFRVYFARQRDFLVGRGFSVEDAENDATRRVEAEVAKLTGRTRDPSQGTVPRGASDAPPLSASYGSSPTTRTVLPATQPIDTRARRPSVVQQPPGRSSQPSLSSSLPHTSQPSIPQSRSPAAALPSMEKLVQGGYTPAQATAIRRLMTDEDEWTLDSAIIIVRLMQRGHTEEAAMKVAVLVERGMKLEQALESMRSNPAQGGQSSSSKNAQGRGGKARQYE